jgi:hypothetical protein
MLNLTGLEDLSGLGVSPPCYHSLVHHSQNFGSDETVGQTSEVSLQTPSNRKI